MKENPLIEIHPKLLAYKVAVSEVTNRSNTKKLSRVVAYHSQFRVVPHLLLRMTVATYFLERIILFTKMVQYGAMLSFLEFKKIISRFHILLMMKLCSKEQISQQFQVQLRFKKNLVFQLLLILKFLQTSLLEVPQKPIIPALQKLILVLLSSQKV